MKKIFSFFLFFCIVSNSFAKTSLNEINELGNKIDNCREYFLKAKIIDDSLSMKHYQTHMEANDNLQKCYKTVAIEIFEKFYTHKKQIMTKQLEKFIEDNYDYNLNIYYNSNFCLENCGLIGYLYANQATSYDLQNYLIRMLSQLEAIYKD